MKFGDECVPSRLWDKVHPEPNTGCWLWGANHVYGYGLLTGGDHRSWRAHRYFLFMETGETGEHARHLCHTRACVNPDHLAWGTAQDNSNDARKAGRGYAGRTHCPQGHPYDDENTVVKTRDGESDRRVCRICSLEKGRGYNHAARRRAWAQGLALDDPRHGSVTAYVTWRCRCEPCRVTYRDYRKHLPSRQPGYGKAPH